MLSYRARGRETDKILLLTILTLVIKCFGNHPPELPSCQGPLVPLWALNAQRAPECCFSCRCASRGHRAFQIFLPFTFSAALGSALLPRALFRMLPEKAINTSPPCGCPVWGSLCWAIRSRLPVGSGPTQCHPPPNPSLAPFLGLSFIQRSGHLCRGWGEGQNMIVLEIWDLGGYQAPSELIPKLRGCGATTFYPAHGGPAKNVLSPCDPSITVSHPPTLELCLFPCLSICLVSEESALSYRMVILLF